MITVREISKTFFSGRGVVKALQKVSLSVDTGKALALMGKSGSGKTTLLNCVGGLESLDHGTITCFGLDLDRISRKDLLHFQRQQVGFVFQFANLLSYLTVFENITFPLVLNGIDATHKVRRANELLEQIGLVSAGYALPHELSGGELQRVSFARAIAHKPKLLLADEPTANLDSATGLTLVNLMIDLSKENEATLLIATHDPEIVGLADDTLELRDGKVVA
jgi:putative ABC transport system ATP-binding protein